MRVSEVMSTGVECISPEASLNEAALKMKSLNVGLLPVCENDQVIGMVTDRDITLRAVAEGKDPHAVHVREVMTPGVVYCFADQLLTQAVQLMQQHQVRRLVVLNGDKRVVGVISLGDLAVGTGDDGIVGSTLDALCEAHRHLHKTDGTGSPGPSCGAA